MQKYIPEEKLGKKARRELSKNRRGTWGAVNPVTRKPPNPKAYNRKKARREVDSSRGPFDCSKTRNQSAQAHRR